MRGTQRTVRNKSENPRQARVPRKWLQNDLGMCQKLCNSDSSFLSCTRSACSFPEFGLHIEELEGEDQPDEVEIRTQTEVGGLENPTIHRSALSTAVNMVEGYSQLVMVTLRS